MAELKDDQKTYVDWCKQQNLAPKAYTSLQAYLKEMEKVRKDNGNNQGIPV